ncbi:unnamed protein product, partial [Polarella glacialis]
MSPMDGGSDRELDLEVAYVVSVGSRCLVARLLRDTDLRRYAGPFDWIYSSAQMARHCFADDFTTFLDPDKLVKAGNAWGHLTYGPMLGDRKVIFPHHDPLSAHQLHFARCIDRLRMILASPARKLLVAMYQVKSFIEPDMKIRTSEDAGSSAEDIKELFELLQRQGVRNFELAALHIVECPVGPVGVEPVDRPVPELKLILNSGPGPERLTVHSLHLEGKLLGLYFKEPVDEDRVRKWLLAGRRFELDSDPLSADASPWRERCAELVPDGMNLRRQRPNVSTPEDFVWELIARQDIEKMLFSAMSKLTFLQNEEDADSNAFMSVGLLSPTDPSLQKGGRYHFKLVYDGSVTLEWLQSSWLTSSTIQGFEALSPADIGPASQPEGLQFAGLGKSSNSKAVLDGNGCRHPHWWNCVGALQAHKQRGEYKSGIPGWDGQIVSTMELYISRRTVQTELVAHFQPRMRISETICAHDDSNNNSNNDNSNNNNSTSNNNNSTEHLNTQHLDLRTSSSNRHSNSSSSNNNNNNINNSSSSSNNNNNSSSNNNNNNNGSSQGSCNSDRNSSINSTTSDTDNSSNHANAQQTKNKESNDKSDKPATETTTNHSSNHDNDTNNTTNNNNNHRTVSCNNNNSNNKVSNSRALSCSASGDSCPCEEDAKEPQLDMGFHWQLIASQDIEKACFGPAAASSFLSNEGDPTSNAYMSVGCIDERDETFRVNGQYRFRLIYDGIRLGRIVLDWLQTSWITAESVEGFSGTFPKDIGPAALPAINSFTGLRRSKTAASVLTGSSGGLPGWNCVGAVLQHQGGIAGWNRQICSTMQLYVARRSCQLPCQVSPAVPAALRLPSVFSDHMVLQCSCDIPVWGVASPGELVTVRLGALLSQTSTAAEDGRWEVVLPPQLPSAVAKELCVEAGSKIVFRNVLVGEVWLCSGQSNMEWTIKQALSVQEQQEVISSNDLSMIRHLKVPRAGSSTPMRDFRSKWQEVSPETVLSCTAVGTIMALHLVRELGGGVPVGIVSCSCGNSRIESWCAPSSLGSSERFAHLVDKRGAEESSPGALHDAMVHPLVPYALRGAAWYQGEANTKDWEAYRELLPLLIGGWRSQWRQARLPFAVVQLPGFGAPAPESPAQGRWALLRESQDLGARIAGDCGLIATLDIGDANDIHPHNKVEVGRRLANWALAAIYGRTTASSGPAFRKYEELRGGAAWRLHFDHAEGLSARSTTNNQSNNMKSNNNSSNNSKQSHINNNKKTDNNKSNSMSSTSNNSQNSNTSSARPAEDDNNNNDENNNQINNNHNNNSNNNNNKNNNSDNNNNNNSNNSNNNNSNSNSNNNSTAGGSGTTDCVAPDGFAAAGADGVFRWAEAHLEGDTVVVSSPAIARLAAVRYAWQSNPVRANLVNAA